MLDLLVMIMTAMGIGFLLISPLGMKDLSRWAFLLGLFMMPPLFVVLCSMGLGTATTAGVLLGLGLAGCGAYLLGQPHEHAQSLWAHPLLWMLILLVIGDVLLGLRYRAQHWDEFSYWMLTPKQMGLYGELWSRHFPIQNSKAYLPSVPIWQMFFEFLTQKPFDESRAHLPNYLFAAALLSPLYHNLRKASSLKDQPFIAGALSLLVLAFAGWGEVSQPNALVEPAFYISFAAVLLLILEEQDGALKDYQFWPLLIFMLTGGYYVKKHFIFCLPALCLFWLYGIFRHKEGPFKRKALWLLLTILTFGGFAGLWWLRTKMPTDAISTTSKWEEIVKGYDDKGGLPLLLLIMGRTLQHFVRNFALQVLAFWGLYLYWKRVPKGRAFFVFIAVFIAALIGALVYGYLVVFTRYESMHVVSIDRYLSYATVPIRIAGIYLLLRLSLSEARMARLKSWFAGYRAPLFFAVVFLLNFVIFYALRFPNPSDPIQTEIKNLVAQEPKGPGLLIAQGDSGLVFQVFQYMTVHKPDLLQSLRREYSFFPTRKDEWTTELSAEDFTKKVDGAHFIWVHHSDEFTTSVLKPKLPPECSEPLQKVLLVRSGQSWVCHNL